MLRSSINIPFLKNWHDIDRMRLDRNSNISKHETVCIRTSGVVQSRPELVGVIRSCAESCPEPSAVIQSRPESLGVVQRSHLEPLNVIRSRPVSFRAVWSRLKSSRVVRSRLQSSRVVRSHPMPSRVVRSWLESSIIGMSRP